MSYLSEASYGSLSEALTAIETHAYDQEQDDRSAVTATRGFTETSSLDEALSLAREGWAEHTDTALAMVKQVLDTSDIVRLIEEHTPVRRRTVAGGRVDVGRFLSGDPKCMVRRQRVTSERSKRVIRVLVGLTVSGSTDTESMVRQGAVLTALVDVLTTIGYAVELVVELTTDPDGHRITDLVTIKRADQPLDIEDVLFALAHPSMLRRIGFALWEMRPAKVRKACRIYAGGGYGHVPNAPTQGEGADLVLTMGSRHIGTNGVEWIKAQVESLTGA